MRSLETSQQEQEQAHSVQRQIEPGAAFVVDGVTPIAQSPTFSIQSKEVGIQRQCSECAKEQQQESAEEGKEVDERSLWASAIQTKLTVGAAGDKYEQEADRVAAQVMSMSVAPDSSPQVQRFGEESNPVQKWSLAQSITPVAQRQVDEQVQLREIVQRAFQPGGTQASGDLESRLNASKGGGSALSPEVRAFMEPRFGADFSSVRVHTGAEAVQMNRELGAQAFAHGSDVYFGPGKSPGNNELTAHELTHVVQQTGGVQKRLLSNPQTVQQKCSNCEDDQVKLKENPEPVISREAAPVDLAITSISTSTIQRADGPCKDVPPRIPHHLIIRDSVHPDVREAQRKLNLYHKQELAASRPGLPDALLVEDCIFGQKTYNATLAFQKQVFPKQPREHDGKIGDNTWAELDKLSGTPPAPTPPAPTPPVPTPPAPTPDPDDAPCKPYSNLSEAKAKWFALSKTIPSGAAAATNCSAVKPVWDAYFAATSKSFAFSDSSNCVVTAAKTDSEASASTGRAAKGLFKNVIDYLPVTLQGVKPLPFSIPGYPIDTLRLPLTDAIGPHGPLYLHLNTAYNNAFNAAANIAGAVGGSDLFGDDDREIGGKVVIDVTFINPISGGMSGEVRWLPHIHVKDTVDFCPGNKGNWWQSSVTIPMSNLEATGLTRDVPITIDYDLDLQESKFNNVIPKSPEKKPTK
jgi:hypothetical protein